MKKTLSASAAAVFALAIVAPAFAGPNCGSHKTTAATVTADAASCHSKGASAAWAGAWLQRSEDGQVTVADVAKGSPAAKAGLKSGDVVLAVNGYDLNDTEARAMCASKAECNVGSKVTYTVQRGKSTKNLKFKLEKMPADATDRFASRNASFDPVLAAVVMPTLN
jgi:S1-C subfamily serine protease